MMRYNLQDDPRAQIPSYMSRGNCTIYNSDVLTYLGNVFLDCIWGPYREKYLIPRSPLESDSFRRLAGGTSFLLGLIRGGGGTVHAPKSAEVSLFSHIYLTRRLYIFL